MMWDDVYQGLVQGFFYGYIDFRGVFSVDFYGGWMGFYISFCEQVVYRLQFGWLGYSVWFTGSVYQCWF